MLLLEDPGGEPLGRLIDGPMETGRFLRFAIDLAALGVTFYQMLTGRLPFSAADPMEWVQCTRRPGPLTMMEMLVGHA